MTKTIQAPPELDSATLRAHTKREGEAVAAGETLATFDLDGKTVPLASDVAGVVARHLLKEGQLIGGGAAVAIVAEPGEDIGWDPRVVRAVRVMVLRRCDECGNDYPVNGLVEAAKCTRCGDLQRSPAAFWKDYLAEDVAKARTPREGAGGNVLAGRHGACTHQAWGVPVLCRKCTTLLPWNAVVASWTDAQKGAAQVPCAACGEPHRVRVPPEWATAVFGGIGLLVGETATTATPEPAKPVVFKCPSCMAALKIDGVKRIVHCAFCDSDLYLPDDLWLHFNPATRRARWWMLLKP